MSLSSVFPLPKRRKPVSVLPGFGPALGLSPLYPALVVLTLLPVTVLETFIMTWDAFWTIITAPCVVTSYKLTLSAPLITAIINLAFRPIVAQVLVCYRFPGKRLIDVLVDLPFTLPTTVAGITLTASYVPDGWIGSWLEPLGLKVAFISLGTMMTLTFTGSSFVVRTVQLVLEDLETELEEATASLGATCWQTSTHAILSVLLLALLTGFALAFARTTGEYGSVTFIAGNVLMASETTSLMIYSKLEQFDCVGATIVAVVIFGVLFTLLLAVNLLQAWMHRHGNRNGTVERAPEPSITHAATGT